MTGMGYCTFYRSHFTVIEHEALKQSVSYKNAVSEHSTVTQKKRFCENGYNRQLGQAGK